MRGRKREQEPESEPSSKHSNGHVELSAHGDDEFRPGLEIRILRNMVHRYLGATLPEEADTATGGNTPILMYLFKHRSYEIFQYDIEKRFGLARSTASRVLSLMEKKGLIERQVVQRDARLRRIVLTEKALPITHALEQNAERMEKVMLTGMSEQDQRRLAGYLNQMKSNLINTGKIGTGYDCSAKGTASATTQLPQTAHTTGSHMSESAEPIARGDDDDKNNDLRHTEVGKEEEGTSEK